MTDSGDSLSAGNVVTQLLAQWGKGDQAALDQLLPLVYRELHKIAKHYMNQQGAGHTLQTTAVIHEAYLKLAAGADQDWHSRAHFFGVAAKAMRHVLVDHARSRKAAKRGGEIQVVEIDEGLAVVGGPAQEIVALDDALQTLAASYPRQAEVVELRYFGGLSVEDTAKTLNVSPETVARDWKFAKSFLRREIRREAKAGQS
ncbi:MAG TPA: sigma-70 family RNA polymerase sigma factor [Bryobacteraceae bacterium]|nr:sigma-70 family RNA polymerase sigma factor [Bryobacteraceae bacterium]